MSRYRYTMLVLLAAALGARPLTSDAASVAPTVGMAPAGAPVAEEPPPVVVDPQVAVESRRPAAPAWNPADSAQTPGQRSVAAALNDAGWQRNPDLRTVVEAIGDLPVDQRPDALDALSPVEGDVLSDAGLAGLRGQLDGIESHLSQRRLQALLDDEDAGTPWTAWADTGLGIGAGARQEDYDDEPLTLGAAAGIDHAFGKQFLLGLHLGFSRTTVDHDDSPTDGTVDGIFYGTYAAYMLGHGHVQVALDQAAQSYEDERYMKIGSAERVARSERDGQGTASFVESGYDFLRGNWTFSPFVMGRYTHLGQDAYTEEGAGSLNLSVDDQTGDYYDSRAGTTISHVNRWTWASFSQRARIGWIHEFESDGRDIDAHFTGTPESGFTVTGPEGEADGMELSGGLSLAVPGCTAFMDCGTVPTGPQVVRSLSVGLRSRF